MTAAEPPTAPVVVGIDGSPEAMDAVRYSVPEARRRSAPLDLVLVFPWSESSPVPAPDGFDGRAVLHTMAELALDAAVRLALDLGAAGVSSRIIEGKPADLLVRESTGAALLCLGSRGTGAAYDALLGSTAAAVVRQAACPVLVVPYRPGTSVDRRAGVVVGLGGEPGDAELLAQAFPEAEALGAELLAVHAWHRPGPARRTIDPVLEDSARRGAEQALADVLDAWALRYPEVPVRRVVEHDRAAPTLVSAALTAELVVVGHGRRRMFDRLGSVTHAVLHRVACPVLVVPLGLGETGKEAGNEAEARSPEREPAPLS